MRQICRDYATRNRKKTKRRLAKLTLFCGNASYAHESKFLIASSSSSKKENKVKTTASKLKN